MTQEMTVLLLLPALGLVYILNDGITHIIEHGLQGAFVGPRDDLPPFQATWSQRGERAKENFKESLPWAVALLLLVQVTGLASETTALGAWIYFSARVVYLPVYLLGVPLLRSFVWIVSIAGLVMVASPALRLL